MNKKNTNNFTATLKIIVITLFSSNLKTNYIRGPTKII